MFLLLALSCSTSSTPVSTLEVTAPVQIQTHKFTFKNSCAETVWVGSTGKDGASAINEGGWEMKAGSSLDVAVPVGNSGRVWPRTGCSFGPDGNCLEKGVNCCATGGCLGTKEQTFALQCTAPGVPPASLLEWTLDATSGNGPIDYYDMSFVDGWSIPLTMSPVAGTYNTDPDSGIDAWWCETDGCDQGMPVCPDAYQVLGSPLSCYSPCQAAKNAGSPDLPKLCCTCSTTDPITCPDPKCAGAYGCTPYHDPAYPADMVCDPWNKDATRAWDSTALSYIDVVKKHCPKVYSWQFADTKATFNCRKTDGVVDYVIEFCPAAEQITPSE